MKNIRRFDQDQDIFSAFMEKEKQETRTQKSKKSPETVQKNRHGLPVLQKEIASAFGISEIPSFPDQKPPPSPALEKDSHLQALPNKPVPLKKRLKRYPPVETQLDLHGFTALGAELKARTFIQSHLQQGYFTLRIIVGKGLHSEAGAVLPHVIEDLLTEIKKQGQVLAFEWEGGKKSAKGAVIVYLNQFGDETL